MLAFAMDGMLVSPRPPENMYVAVLIPIVMVLGGGAFGRHSN